MPAAANSTTSASVLKKAPKIQCSLGRSALPSIRFDRGYLWACAAVLLTAGLRFGLSPVLGESAPLLAFMLPVGAVAIFCGHGPGAVATLLSAALGVFLFVGEMGFAALGTADLARVLMFIVIGLTLSALAGRLAEAQRAAEDRAARLRFSAGRKDEFIAMLGHELRNPLSAIKAASLVMVSAEVDERKRIFASNVMARQIAIMSKLLDQLLDVSRLNAGLAEMNKKVVALQEVIDEAMSQCAPLFEESKVNFSHEGPGQVLHVMGDKLRLVQALSNLLSNAAKFTSAGGEVRLVARSEGPRVYLVVEDNGTGISTQDLPHIFEAFVQGPRSLSRSEGGLGLGLAVVQKIALLHGGSVHAESGGPDCGSRFVMTLPLQADPSQ